MPSPLALTLGEPAGIGPDIAFAAWRRRAELDLPPFYLLADPHFVARPRASGSASTCRSPSSTPQQAGAAFEHRAAGGPTRRAASPPSPASPIDTSAPAAHRLDPPRRRRCLRRRAPARSSPIRSPRTCSTASGFADPGHTEYLAQARRGSDRHAGAAGDDAVVAGACGGAGHHPSAAARRGRAAHHRPHRRDRPHRRARSRATASASRSRASRLPGSIRMPARTARSATRTAPIVAPAVERLAAPKASTRAARCRPTRCSTRPRARATTRRLCMYHDQALIPIKTLAFDHARQRHARAAVRAHLARPRHRLRHRRHRPRQSREPDRGAAACGTACRAIRAACACAPRR